MPNLVNKPYDPNSGEWFPYNGDESLQDAANTRSRAMYFFHNSLGEVFENQLISFSNEITTADNGDQNGNDDQNGNGDQNGDNNGGQSGNDDQNGDAVADDTQSWPILDDDEQRIETYSNGDPCYRYRFNASNDGIPTRARFRIWEPVNPTSNDVAIFNRYVAALKTIFSSQTASIQLNNVERTSGSQGVPNESFWTETGTNILPFDGLNFPIYNETPDNTNGNSGYNIICDGDILSRAVDLQAADLIPRFPNERIGSGPGVNSGILDWNAVSASTTQRSFRNSSIDGQFIVGDVVENYVFGDYLLLTALGDDAENDLFDQRVVFVRGTSETLVNDELVPAISIETLDDIGFEPQPEGSFIITKLTNAPKLKITYRVNESSATDTETIVATDNEDDV